MTAIADMIALVRQDLHDEVSAAYRWTDAELTRHINRTVKEYSEALPLEQKATLATTAGSRDVTITSLTSRIMIQAVEYPIGQFPARFQRFAYWNEVLSLVGLDVPNGGNCYVYYGKLHTLGATSTIPTAHEDLVAGGAAGYASIQQAGYAINQVNTGGITTPDNWESWGQKRINLFRAELKRLGKTNKVRVRQLYTPAYPVVSKSTDYGP